jgi:hypothetical protein
MSVQIRGIPCFCSQASVEVRRGPQGGFYLPQSVILDVKRNGNPATIYVNTFPMSDNGYTLLAVGYPVDIIGKNPAGLVWSLLLGYS